jgi:hypothetical protein
MNFHHIFQFHQITEIWTYCVDNSRFRFPSLRPPNRFVPRFSDSDTSGHCSNEKDIQDDEASLSIVCWSHQKYSKDAFLGQVVIPLVSLNGGVAIKQWWPFAPRDDSDKNVTGKINLEIQLITDAVRFCILFSAHLFQPSLPPGF